MRREEKRREEKRLPLLLAVLLSGASIAMAQQWGWVARASYPRANYTGASLLTASWNNEADTGIFGEQGSCYPGADTWFRYDPGTDAWTGRKGLPGTWKWGRGSALCDCRANEILVFIGAPHSPTTSFRTYDMQNNAFGSSSENAAVGPDSARAFTHAVIGGTDYVIGHWDFHNGFDSLWRYNIDANTWADRKALPSSAGYGAGIVWYQDDVFFLTRGRQTTTFWRYVDGTPAFTTMKPVPENVFHGGALAGTGHDRLYCLAGRNSGPGSAGTGFHCYDVINDTWFAKPSTPAGVDDGGALASLSDSLFAFRGDSTATFWRYAESMLSSNDSFAIGRNNARHLARKPGTDSLYLSYDCHGVLYYAVSGNGGTTWSYPLSLGKGKSPTLVLQEGKPWIAYVKNGQDIACKFRAADGTWSELVVDDYAGDDTADSPSIVRAAPSVWDDFAHVVYRGRHRKATGDYTKQIKYCHFRTSEVDEETQLWKGDAEVSPPCVAATSGADSVHVVWVRSDTVRYREKAGGSWLDEATLGAPDTWPFPASNPFVEADGESLAVAWTGRNGSTSNPGEIYWKRRRLTFGWPSSATLVSFSSATVESDLAVVSTRKCVAWSENGDIVAKVHDATPYTITLISSPDTVTRFANYQFIDALHDIFVGVGSEDRRRDTLYEIRPFNRHSDDETDGGSYFAVGVGDPVASPYCQTRDGRAEHSGIRADTAAQSLRYVIPYLNRDYDYTARLILYHRSANRVSVALNDSLAATISCRAARPETLDVPVPPGLYRYRDPVVIDLTRIGGDDVALAGLSLYQHEPVNRGGFGGGQSAATSPARVRLLDMRPNPTSGRTTLRYQMQSAARVRIRLVDAVGREQRLLVNANLPAGEHTVDWDGRSMAGQRVPPGVFFCVLETAAGSSSRKLLVTY